MQPGRETGRILQKHAKPPKVVEWHILSEQTHNGRITSTYLLLIQPIFSRE